MLRRRGGLPTEKLLKELLELETRTYASKAAAKAELVKVLERNLEGGKLTAKELKELEGAAGQLLKGRIANAPKTAQEAIAQAKKNTGNYALYNFKELEANPRLLRPGERVLDVPNRAITWAENEAALRQAMAEGKAIREATPNARGVHLDLERGVLKQAGWTFDPKTGFWNPPAK